MANKTLLLFDLDNTLYHYDPCGDAGLRAAHRELSSRIDVEWTRFAELHDRARLRLAEELPGQAASHDRFRFFRRIVEELGRGPDPELTLAVTDAFWAAFHEQMSPAPEAIAVLEELGGRYDLALVSNQTTRTQYAKLRRLGVAAAFRVIVTSEDAGADKPDRRIFEYALNRCGRTAGEAAMIGDDLSADVAGAQALGIEAVHARQFATAVDGGIRPDHAVDRLAELLDLY